MLENDDYITTEPDAGGLLKSRVIPGLWLEPAALLAGDHARVQAVLAESLASEEHAEFARGLAADSK